MVPRSGTATSDSHGPGVVGDGDVDRLGVRAALHPDLLADDLRFVPDLILPRGAVAVFAIPVIVGGLVASITRYRDAGVDAPDASRMD